ncbi:hypothetical protein [Nocardia cyriacigeorgica]|uniref:hypothetical protein n=1 Tax=Nocardia cyriacigeorgica TaxID=135487 RepID=UPI0018946E99|nr:hypothetical protein [Nocardia cyriacigeorgica]MBF6434983.1 hypothetical protein [Nocardia cyriacigeorgica]MBF6454937.1 hypothetical protein [Nocardia cyriacigeorgica]MBF6481984.1 hypothetical protein [Nocardia cyriacigeorgica]MBF6552832.1 hypothetical protein [Nocardia cyriacigeorgica]
MCSPSATLTVWAGSWLAGSSAPDDVLEALHAWAPRHTIAAGDPFSGARTDLPWSSRGTTGTGVMPLLKVIREALAEPGAHLRLVLPVPGDVRGLPVGTAFAADAIEAGEGILIGVPGADGTGLIPQWESEDTLQWTVYSAPIPATTGIDMSLGEAEFAMREAVRDAADALMRLHTTGLGSGDADPRELIEAELADYSRHDYPESIPLRARRILDSADHVAAILTVAQREPASSPTSASAVIEHESLLRPLWDAIRAARLVAVHASARRA